MKKLTTLVLLGVLCLNQLYAQTEKGNISLGTTSTLGGSSAGLNFTSNNQDEEKEFNFNLSPNIGIFVSDNFLIGGTLALDYSRLKDDDFDFEATSTGFRIGPLLRYYFTDSKIKPFINFNPTFTSVSQKTEVRGDEAEFDLSGFSMLGNVGVAFFLNEKLSLDLSLGINYTSLGNNNFESNINTTTFGLNVGFSFFK